MAVFGTIVSNTSEKSLVITEVSLVEAENFELVGADIVALDADNTYALGAGSTEADGPEAKAAWDRRVAVESFKLPPGQYANILVTADNGDATVGSSQGLRIGYEQNLGQFVAASGTALVLQDKLCVPPG